MNLASAPSSRTSNGTRGTTRRGVRWVLGMMLGTVVVAGALLVPASGALAAGTPQHAGTVATRGTANDVKPAEVSAESSVAKPNVENFTFDSFEGVYTLSRDAERHSRVDARETFVARFPEIDQNRGIVRAIPRDFRGVDLGTTVESVTDAQGVAVPFSIETTRSNTVVSIGDESYLRGVHTFVLHYTQRDSTRYFSNTRSDEFYRDSIGTQLRQPVDAATMKVIVDPTLVPNLTTNQACYVGPEKSSQRCEFSRTDADGAAVFTSAQQRLAPGENITMSVGFTAGTFAQTKSLGEQPIFSWLPAVLAALSILLVIFAAILRHRRNPRVTGDGIVVAQYTPQPGVDLGVAADLLHKRNLPQAAMVDLAVRGKLRIVETEGRGLFSKKSTFTLEFQTPEEGKGASARVLRALFGKDPDIGDTVSLDKPSQKLTEAMTALTSTTREQALAQGLRRWEKLPAAGWWALTAVLAFITTLSMTITAASQGGAPELAIGATIVTGITMLLMFVFAVPVAALSADGMRAVEYLKGLKLYLEVAEEDRLRILQSPQGAERVDATGPAAGADAEAAAIEPQRVLRLYEALLPYAVLWGVEKEWAKTLAGRYETDLSEPNWYVGQNGFNAAALGLGIAGFNSAVSTASSWSSSGGSSTGGSMGGGFSGGGAGGGGVGGR
ncbi:DUF2207 domain-containing protein [Mycetocola lacteus]|uniref:DUF2207 domain-containing protein n=1 Tax=Mycetocola lacteus TaxID=76637 RepID=A0A3L7AUM2_9MICO|nr:DUF2207 domain-containing protein [Mycetocola lacteus]RLP83188.1 DUF2207 domain-containing protein [Mycetocola lacteus]